MLTLCRLDHLVVGKPRLAKAGNHLLLLVRTGTVDVHAYLNRCPHLGIPLAWQDSQLVNSEGTHFICSTHGALFEFSSGYCISGPCQGDQLWAFDCTVADGDVRMDESELPTGR